MKEGLLGVLFYPDVNILAGDGLNWSFGALPPLSWIALRIGMGIEAVEAEAIRYIGEIVAKAVGPGCSRGTSGVLNRADRIESLIRAAKDIVGVGAGGIDVAGCRCLGGAGAG